MSRSGETDRSGDSEAAGESESLLPDPREFLSPPETEAEDEETDGRDEEDDVEGPEVPSSEDVPRSVRLSFWWLVLVCNGVVLALFLGVMYGVFENNWDLGGRLLASGGVLSVYVYYKYRTFPREEIGETSDGSEGDAEPEDAGSEPGPDPEAGGDTRSEPNPEDDTESEPEPDAGSETDVAKETSTKPGDPAPGEPVGPPSGTVADADGNQYLLVKQSGDASLVRDPASGEQRYLPNDEVELVGESPLETAAGSVPAPARRVLSAAHDDRSLGLLVEVVDRGAVPVRSLLSEYDLCESDLHGLLGEFRAAGLLAETTVAGERGYEPTETAVEGVAHLRATGRE